MIRCHFVLPLLLLCGALSQGVAQERQGDAALLLRNSSFWATYRYQFPDGTPVPDKDVRSLIVSAPGNAPLLTREKGWRVAGYVLAGVFLSSFAVLTTCQFVDMPYAGTITGASIATCLISFPSLVLAGQIAGAKLQRSVDNYNLFIMGISKSPVGF